MVKSANMHSTDTYFVQANVKNARLQKNMHFIDVSCTRWNIKPPGGKFNTKILSCQYRNSSIHLVKVRKILVYLHNINNYLDSRKTFISNQDPDSK